MFPTHTLRSGDVALVLGLSVARIHQLDEELMPERALNGSRRYSVEAVQRVLAARKARP